MSAAVRPTAVAGLFYPDDPAELKTMVEGFLHSAQADGPPPKAIIVPHAGYPFSGAVAASAYARLAPLRDRIRRVVLLGPSHRVPLRGIAAPTAELFESPLGNVRVDQPAIASLDHLPQVSYLDEAHRLEHSLEVHLPFLQTLFDDFTLVPLVVGDTRPERVAEVLEALWGGDETLIVISSDLSHYHPYEDARKRDSRTSQHIETLDYQHIEHDDACGRNPVNGLLYLAKQKGLGMMTLDLCNSGDTAGSRDRVVGYGAYVLTGGFRLTMLSESDRRQLLALADRSIREGLVSGHPLAVDLNGLSSRLAHPGASFVTLRLNGQLRGCIGTLEAWRPLAQDCSANAFAAAFRDPRFAPVTAGEYPSLQLHISILEPAKPLPVKTEDELLDQLRAGEDGLVLVEGSRRATFLPSVWEQLPDPGHFVRHLKRKAGLPDDYWSPTLQFLRYGVEELVDESAPSS